MNVILLLSFKQLLTNYSYDIYIYIQQLYRNTGEYIQSSTPLKSLIDSQIICVGTDIGVMSERSEDFSQLLTNLILPNFFRNYAEKVLVSSCVSLAHII